MRSLLKVLSVIGAIFSIFIFSLIYVGEKIIPDNIITVEDMGYNAPSILGLKVFGSRYTESAGAIVNKKQLSQNNAEITLLNIIPVKSAKITNMKRQYVTLGGEIFGIKLYTEGVIVVGADTIETENGTVNIISQSGIKVGDVILSLNGEKITSTNHLSQLLNETKGNECKIVLNRDGKILEINFQTVKEKNTGKYRAGIWVRDSTAGIGTVTFYDKDNGIFAGLGHAVCDVDTNEIMPIKNGEMAEAYINGFYQSRDGVVGELCGVFTGENKGILCLNDETGIYGITNAVPNNKTIPVAVKQEVKTGEVQILCTIDKNGPKLYDAKIIKIYNNSQYVNKDMIIVITDEALISKTGGILQGMSGSPIIQNGMLVGAITHVFVNNTCQGYGIFAERMITISQSNSMIKNLEIYNKAA